MSTNEPPTGPPPPPPGEQHQYGGPPPPPSGYNLGDALGYGWTKFQANLSQFLAAALVLLVVILALWAASFGLTALLLAEPSMEIDRETGQLTSTGGSGFVVTLLVGALLAGLFFVVIQVVAAGLVRGSLGITEGRPFRAGELFRTERLGPVIVLSLINGAAIFVGTMLCYLPGLVYGFISFFSLYFLIDKGLSPVESIKASFGLVKAHLADTLVWYIVGGIIASAGAIVCGVGMLVTVPLVLVATAYAYKTLTGQPVAP